MIKTPKLLPWYARKAGVSIERAEEIWLQAVERVFPEGEPLTNDAMHIGAAMTTFMQLLEREKNGLLSPQLMPLLRTHNRFLRLPLMVMEESYLTFSKLWLGIYGSEQEKYPASNRKDKAA